MSTNDSSTVLSTRGSELLDQNLDNEAEATKELPEFYEQSYEAHSCCANSSLSCGSPYIDSEIISLDVGLSKTRYRIHRSFLAQSPELAAKPSLKLWGEKTHDTVALPELDAVTAHTLVTFLYTGRYETLGWLGAPEKALVAAYKLSTCVYCAAVRYKLSVLAELAQAKIIAHGHALTIFDVLSVAREYAFPILPEDETWFPSYLEGAIKGAVQDDPALFMKPGFVDQIEGDRKFRQVIMKAIINTYSSDVGGGDDPPMDVQGKSNLDMAREPLPTDSKNKELPEANVSIPGNTDNTIQKSNGESLELDDIDPLVPESPTHRPESPLPLEDSEPATQELDPNGRSIQSNLTTRIQTDDTIKANEAPKHIRNDSVVQPEAIELANGQTDGEKDNQSAALETSSPISESTNGPTSSKKSKKKRGKKGGGTGFAGVPS